MPDRLSALPDELLHHILGFLPAHEAVRTSVLARRWRPLWKSVRRLHITTYPVEDEDGDDYGRRTSHFANSLFLMRDSASLDEVKFSYDLPWKKTVMWLRHALLCEAQSVIVHVDTVPGLKWVVQDPPLVSRYLRKLELHQLYLMDIFLDFACCPALEALEISQCDIESEKIISPSVKLLCMDTIYFVNICQTRISVPSLISFQLNKFKGTSPLLESMPLLETALVKPSFGTNDVRPDYIWKSCGSCAICCAEDDFKGRCLLLGGLSHAVNLELTAYPEGTCVFRRDLRWCPTFSRLKTLVLYDFYVASELFTILNHSPILENLTLYLCKGPEHPSETLANNTLMDTPAALSRRLKTIKIRCQDFDHMVYDLLKVLTAWGIDVTIKRID